MIHVNSDTQITQNIKYRQKKKEQSANRQKHKDQASRTERL